MKKEDDRQVYAKLRELRRARGITVSELAKEVGEDSQKVGRIERGKRSLTVDYLMKVSRAFGTPIENLLEKSEEEKKAQGTVHSDILNQVVIMVEELSAFFPHVFSSQHKARIISKIYESVLKIPAKEHFQFLHFFSESLKLFLEKN